MCCRHDDRLRCGLLYNVPFGGMVMVMVCVVAEDGSLVSLGRTDAEGVHLGTSECFCLCVFCCSALCVCA